MKLGALQAELVKIERRRDQLQQTISRQAKELYLALPGKVGLRTVDALILALAPFASPFMRAKLRRDQTATKPSKVPAKANATAPAASTAKSKTRKRPKVRSPEQKSSVKQAFKEGKLTTREIAAKFGVPFNTLKKWKRTWGLTSGASAKKA